MTKLNKLGQTAESVFGHFTDPADDAEADDADQDSATADVAAEE